MCVEPAPCEIVQLISSPRSELEATTVGALMFRTMHSALGRLRRIDWTFCILSDTKQGKTPIDELQTSDMPRGMNVRPGSFMVMMTCIWLPAASVVRYKASRY